jgi:branched-chain amino acid transport system permease protein
MLQQLVTASLYALVAVGFVVIFRATKVFNLAQGSLVLGGAFLATTIAERVGGNPLIIALVLCVATGFGGALIYLIIFRPVLITGHLILLMVSLALSTVLVAVATTIWGTQTRFLHLNIGDPTILLPFHLSLSLAGLSTIVIGFGAVLAIAAMLRFTRLGVATRATAENPSLATYRGTNVVATSSVMWGLAAVAGALAGTLYSVEHGVNTEAVNTLGFAVFPVMIVGGLESVGGVVVGSIIVAEVQAVAISLVGGLASDAVGYLLLLVFLLFRPYGLFGRRELVRI